MTDELFNIKWKGKLMPANHRCNNSMNLWIGLNNSYLLGAKNVTREQWKQIVLSAPWESTNNCGCKPCRYRRWFGK